MRKHSDLFWTAVILLAIFSVLATAPASGQARGRPPAGPPKPGEFPPYKAPRLPGTNRPDLNGIWQAMVTANYNLEDHEAAPGNYPEIMGAYGAEPAGQSIIEGGEIPYQPWALEKRKKNFEQRMQVDVSEDATWHDKGDPELKCYLPGVPRANYMPFPFQIVQGTSPFLLITYEYDSAARIVHMENHREAPADSWMGWSNGRWEGDTLVIDVTGFNGLAWLDRAGNFASDTLHVVERFTPVSPYHMMYEATIEDPKVYTRPWKISFPLYRRMEKNVQLLEYKCVPFTEELLYGPYKKQSAK